MPNKLLSFNRTVLPVGLLNFPVLLNASNIPSEVFSEALNGGGDIWFSLDLEGSNKIPCEVCQFDKPGNKAEIFVNIPDTTVNGFYIWWNKGDQTQQPASDSIFGAQKVWDINYVGIWHNPYFPTDSTSYGNNGSFQNISKAAQVEGVWGGYGISLPQTDINEYGPYAVISGRGSLQFAAPLTIEAWILFDKLEDTYPIKRYGAWISKSNSSDDSNSDWQLRGLMMCWDKYSHDAEVFYNRQGGVEDIISSTIYDPDTWLNVSVSIDSPRSGSYRFVNNGKIDGQGFFGDCIGGTNDLTIGMGSSMHREYWHGLIDEVRISKTVRSPQWLAAQYANHSDPGNFITHS